MMKKLAVVGVVGTALMAFMLAGCGGSSTDSSTESLCANMSETTAF